MVELHDALAPRGHDYDPDVAGAVEPFVEAWDAGRHPRIDDYLDRVPEYRRPATLAWLLYNEVDRRLADGDRPQLNEYLSRFPSAGDDLRHIFRHPDNSRVGCPHCSDAAFSELGTVGTEGTADGSTAEDPLSSEPDAYIGESGSSITDQAPERVAQFTLLDCVGVGAFGRVYRAEDTHLSRTVALKLAHPKSLRKQEADWFLHEARAAARLKHQNIVRVFETGVENGRPWIATEFVKGLTLEQVFRDERRVTPMRAALLCRQIADALHHAHEAGVVHRDLKPSNILLDEAGQPHVTDFGLAKREAADFTMALPGYVLGTAAYMAPEQARGESHRADRRADVYALGVILFELLTGNRPFEGARRDVLLRKRDSQAPDPRSLDAAVPQDLAAICLKCLGREPRERYATTRELADDLGRYLEREPISARPIGRPERLWRWSQRRPAVTGLIATIVLTLIAASALTTYFVRDLQRIRWAAEADRLVISVYDGLRKSPEERLSNLRLAIRSAEATDSHGEPITQAAEQAIRDTVRDVGGIGIEMPMGYGSVAFNGHRLLASQEAPSLDGSYGPSLLFDLSDVRDGVSSFVLRDHVFSTDGTWVATRSANSDCAIWGPSPGVVEELDLPENEDLIAITADGKWLISRAGRRCHLWRLGRKGTTHEPLPIDLRSSEAAIEISPDGRWLVAQDKSVVRLFDLTREEPADEKHSLDCNATFSRFSPNGRWLVTDEHGTRRIWDLEQEDPSETAWTLGIDVLKKDGHFSHEGECFISETTEGLHVYRMAASEVVEIPFEDSNFKYIDNEGWGGWFLAAQWLGIPGRERLPELSEPLGSAESSVEEMRCVRLFDLRSPALARRLKFKGQQVAIDGSRIVMLIEPKDGSTAVRVHNLDAADPHEGYRRIPFGSPLLVDGSRMALTSRWLITGNDKTDKVVQLWPLDAGEQPQPLTLPQASFAGPSPFSADHRWFFTTNGREVQRWDLASVDPSKSGEARVGGDTVRGGIDVSLDGRRVFMNDADAGSRGRLLEFGPCDRFSEPMVLTPGGAVPSRAYLPEYVLPGVEPTMARSFSEDGRFLFTIHRRTGDEDEVRLWPLSSGEDVGRPTVLPGHVGGTAAVAVTRNGRYIATAGPTNDVRLWKSAADGRFAGFSQVVGKHEGRIESVGISRDGRWLATCSQFAAYLWDMEKGAEAAPHPLTTLGEWNIPLATSADERWLFCSNQQETIVYDLFNGQPATASRPLNCLERVEADGLIHDATIGPTGRWACVLLHRDLTLLDLRDDRAFKLIAGVDGRGKAGFSADGRWLLTAAQYEAQLWDVASERPWEAPFKRLSFGDGVVRVALSHNSRWAAVCGVNEVRMWSTLEEDQPRVFRSDGSKIVDLTFSSDDERLVTVHEDGSVRLWTLNASRLLNRARRIAGATVVAEPNRTPPGR